MKKYFRLNSLLLILIIILERVAWWNLILQFPIYLTQKDAPGSLQWEQVEKGLLYLVWALLQNAGPVFLSPFIDKIGNKKSLTLTSVVIVLNYIILANFTNQFIIWVSVLIFGVFSGVFKAANTSFYSELMLQKSEKSLSLETSKQNGKNLYHWAVYILLVNLGGFFIGTPLSFYLKNISWEYVFYGSALTTLIGLILSLFLKSESPFKDVSYIKTDDKTDEKLSLAEKGKNFVKSLTVFKDFTYIYPVLLMSAFFVIYLIFYEYLPNYIYDWINTQDLVTRFNISQHFQTTTSLGRQISYEWFYNLNTGVIILLILPLTYLSIKFKIKTLYALLLGQFFTIIGISLCFLANVGYSLALGIVVYTLGEMICSSYILKWAEENKKEGKESQYFAAVSYANTVGYAIGAFFGAYYFQIAAEKAKLSSYYNSINTKVGLAETQKLWNEFKPYEYIYPFVFFALISFVLLLLFAKKIYSVKTKKI